jgi:hypothetical protein
MNFMGSSPKTLGLGMGPPLDTLKTILPTKIVHAITVFNVLITRPCCPNVVKLLRDKSTSIGHGVGPVVWNKANTSSIIYHEFGQLVPLVVFAPYHHFLNVNHKTASVICFSFGEDCTRIFIQ